MPTVGAMSNYLENKLLNHVLRGVSYTAPDKVYVALYTSDPTDTDIGVEVSGGSYERCEVTFTSPVAGEVSNATDIFFPEATANWGEVTHFGIRDAATGGNLLFHGEAEPSKVVLSGDQLIIKAGQLVVKLD